MSDRSVVSSAHNDEPGRVLCVMRWPVGGIRTHILYNYPTLADAGYRFTFVGPADESTRNFAATAPAWCGTTFVEAPVSGAKCYLFSVVRTLLRSGAFSVVHAHGLTSGINAVLANLGIGVPTVITIHDTRFPAEFTGRMGQMKRIVLGEVLRRATVLVPCSRACRENHLDYFPRLTRGPCRIATIDNGIDVRRFSEPTLNQENLRDQLRIAENVHLLGYLGRYMYEKGFDFLLQALTRLLRAGFRDRVHLVAVGSGDCRRQYEQQVLGDPLLAPHVTFLEQVTDVVPLLNQLDTVVIPSLRESGPLVPMEAMCAGVPVVGTNCIGLADVLNGGPAFVVAKGDASALAAGIQSAIESRVRHKQLALQYKSIARVRFDVTRRAEELLAIIQTCTNDRSKKRRPLLRFSSLPT